MDGNYSARNGANDVSTSYKSKSAQGETTVGDDFPMLCETCLGENPYVRMVKLNFGDKLCKISGTPYQAFRWKAGPKGRYKETVISFPVAKERNICQTCLNDMVFGVPAGLRDKLLSQSRPNSEIAIPHSDVGLRHFYQEKSNNQFNEHPQSFAADLQNTAPAQQLEKFSRALNSVSANKHQTAFRNLPKLCSFWLNASCNRVLKQVCPFRPCCGVFAFPEIAGSNKELNDKLIDDLQRCGPITMMKSLDAETKAAFRNALKGNRDEAIRKRVSGEDDLTSKYLGRMKSMNYELEAPADQSITTLWLGNIEADISEEDVTGAVYGFGHVASLHMVRGKKCCFLEYADRQSAEHAAGQMYGLLKVKGYPISVKWAKARAVAQGMDQGLGNAFSMPAPPGYEHQSVFAYSNPNMPPPPPAQYACYEGSSNKRSQADVSMSMPLSESAKVRKVGSYDSMNPSRLGSN